MKYRIATLVLPLVMTCSVAFADNTTTTTMSTTTATSVVTPATTMMPVTAILKQLQADGYMCIKKIEMEHGVYEVKAIKSNQLFKLKINPQTGAIEKQEAGRKFSEKEMNKMSMNMSKVTIEQAAANVEKAGYTSIMEIECVFHHGYYKVKAMNAAGEKVKLEVSKETGVVSIA